MATAAEREATASRELEHIKPYSWFVLSMLCLVYIFNFLDRQLFATLGTYIAKDMDLTDAELGKLGGIYFAAFYTIIGIPIGWLADRTNRVRILALGCTVWSLATGGCGLSQNFLQLAFSRMSVGVGEAGGAPPSYSIISDYFPSKQRGTALAIFSLGVPLGQAAAVAFGVKIAESKPLRENFHHLTGFDLSGWRIAFLALSVMGVIAAVALITLVREPKRGAKEAKLDIHMTEAPAVTLAEEKAKLFPTMRDFFGRPALLYTSLSCGAAAFVAYGVLNWTVPLLQRQKHIPGDSLALWYALELALVGSFGIWLSGALVDKLSKKGKAWYALVPAVAFTVVIPFYLAFLWAPTWQVSLLFLSVPVLLNTFYLAPALAAVQNSVRPAQRTMAGALLLLVLNLIGLGLGPTYVGNMSTDVFLPKLVAGFTQLHSMAPAKADLDVLKAQGLLSAMYALAPFYVLAVVFHLVAAFYHRRELTSGLPGPKAVSRNVMLVKFAVGIVGAAAIYKYGPAIVWFKDLLYGVFGVFLLLGVYDLVRGHREPA